MATVVRNSGTRQDTFQITLHINGENFGIWDKKTGGELDSDEVKYYPGAMASPESLGGRRMTGNVTLQRLYDKNDDHARINTVFNAVGRGKVDIGIRPMDIDGNPFGKTVHYTGILKRAQMPDIDSESTSAALIEVECSIAGFPAAV